MTETMMGLGPCQVRSKTDNPCPRQAVVELLGVPFCERCAREQEVYFAIGELTQPQSLGNRLPIARLERTRWEFAGRVAGAEKRSQAIKQGACTRRAYRLGSSRR